MYNNDCEYGHGSNLFSFIGSACKGSQRDAIFSRYNILKQTNTCIWSYMISYFRKQIYYAQEAVTLGVLLCWCQVQWVCFLSRSCNRSLIRYKIEFQRIIRPKKLFYIYVLPLWIKDCIGYAHILEGMLTFQEAKQPIYSFYRSAE